MGTRHLTCVVIDGEYKVAQYGQWDGYPSGQGATVLEFLHNLQEGQNFEKFKHIVRNNVHQITEEKHQQYWIDAGAKPDSEWVGMDVSNKFKEAHPELSRDTGAKILNHLFENDGGEINRSVDFAADSLFCEWCYVIDLDKDTLEVYSDPTSELTEADRFYFLRENGNPVALTATFSLHELPTNENFIGQLERSESEEDCD